MKIQKFKIESIYRSINRQLNKSIIKNKVFCIGLHKTGTTTLSNFAYQYGFKTIHSTKWISNTNILNNFEFFADGGSHFDNINEFDYEFLISSYPKAKFILQTRSMMPWVISKLKHAGWSSEIQLEENNLNKINHNDWTYKSLLTIEKFIEHKINYESKVVAFFKRNAPSQLLVVDITMPEAQLVELSRLVEYLRLKSINRIGLVHANEGQKNINIPKVAYQHIESIIKALD